MKAGAILGWLKGQQYQVEHPYTHTAPGGWAWTDLSGGVPDADDTPGAPPGPVEPGRRRRGRRPRPRVFAWLLDLQNSDGGMPTFCRGCGASSSVLNRSSADLTAHALRLPGESGMAICPLRLQRRIPHAVAQALRFLHRTQRPDGAWAPLWFGNQLAPGDENLTYGTSRVLLALATISLEPRTERPDRPNFGAVDCLAAVCSERRRWLGGLAAHSIVRLRRPHCPLEALSAVLQSDSAGCGSVHDSGGGCGRNCDRRLSVA